MTDVSHVSPRKGFSWYGAVFGAVSAANLLFVVFDFTYLRFRDFYFDRFPAVQQMYDPLKGIERHRFTVAYLSEFDQIVARLQSPAAERDKEEIKKLRDGLTAHSREMIDESPFARAGKDGVLELIKNRIRAHSGVESSKDGFTKFFSQTNLNGDDPEKLKEQIHFFQTRIRPLLERNYFRHIGEDGEPIDLFYRYDLGFVIFFWLDFLVRWFLSLSRGELRRWYLFPVRRWYELFNLISPHHDAWARLGRFLPFAVRLRESGFVSGQGIMPDIIHDNAAVIAEEISGMVMVNILAQAQDMIKSQKPGDLLNSNLGREMLKVRTLVESQTAILAAGVLPQLTKDITEMVIFSLNRALEPWLVSPIGFAVRLILVNVNAGVRDGLKAALSDPEGVERMQGILRKSVQQGMLELTKTENLANMQTQSVEIMEALKRWIKEEGM